MNLLNMYILVQVMRTLFYNCSSRVAFITEYNDTHSVLNTFHNCIQEKQFVFLRQTIYNIQPKLQLSSNSIMAATPVTF